MNILFYNPIAQMYGPYFLVFYALVIVTVLARCKYLLRDTTAKLPVPKIPSQPNPYEITYLRSGEHEVLKLVAFQLLENGYLQVEANTLKQVENIPDLSSLSTLERKVVEYFSRPYEIINMIQDFSLREQVQEQISTYDSWLKQEQLLYSEEDKQKNIKIGIIAGTIIVALGIYKLMAAALSGHNNVEFIIAMAIVSLCWLIYICQKPRKRLTYRGQKYLQRLQQAFAGLKNKLDVNEFTPINHDLMLVLALFGMQTLSNTSYAEKLPVFTNLIPFYHYDYSIAIGGCGSISGCGGGCGGGGCGGCGGG